MPDYSYLDASLEHQSEVRCIDFEYSEDAQLFLDDYIDNAYYVRSEYDPNNDSNYPRHIDTNRDGVVDCDDARIRSRTCDRRRMKRSRKRWARWQ